MSTRDDEQGDNAERRAEDNSPIDEIAGIIGGTLMAGGTGSPGDSRGSTGPTGSGGGAAVGGMAARDFVEDQAAMPADPDADNSPDMYAGGGATDVGNVPSNREGVDTPPTLIAADEEDDPAR
jgi:hypothetical protein